VIDSVHNFDASLPFMSFVRHIRTKCHGPPGPVTLTRRVAPGSDRGGFTLIELLVVVLILSIVAAIVQPRMSEVIMAARAADAVSDIHVVQVAVFSYEADQQAWPPEAGLGVIPTGLEAYLPDGFQLVTENYTLDFENWGGSPYLIGVTLVTSNATLGLKALDMMANPKWTAGSKYTTALQ
jgi:prepilin-type N-terminal cleavage/methylation domain-containing protein